MSYEIRDGWVWHGDAMVCRESGRFAVAFDGDILHKHGEEGRVRDWAMRTRTTLRNGGFPGLADALTVVDFPVTEETIAEVNACSDCSGRVRRITERLAEIGQRMEAGPSPGR